MQDPMLVRCTGLQHLLHLFPVSYGTNVIALRLPLAVATDLSKLRELYFVHSRAVAAEADCLANVAPDPVELKSHVAEAAVDLSCVVNRICMESRAGCTYGMEGFQSSETFV
jgi:hypothetical protein